MGQARAGRRRAARLALAGALAAGLTAVPPAGAGGVEPSCPDVLFVGAAGSGQFGLGGEVGHVYDEFRAQVASDATVQVEPLDYPSEPMSTLILDGDEYFAGVFDAVENLHRLLSSRHALCPDTLFVLAGFSQGAMVMSETARQLGGVLDDRLASVQLLANPVRIGGMTYNRGGASERLNGVAFAYGVGGGALPADLTGRANDYCRRGDLVCEFDYNRYALLLGLGATKSPPWALAWMGGAARRAIDVHTSGYLDTIPVVAGRAAAADVNGLLPDPWSLPAPTLTVADEAYGCSTPEDYGRYCDVPAVVEQDPPLPAGPFYRPVVVSCPPGDTPVFTGGVTEWRESLDVGADIGPDDLSWWCGSATELVALVDPSLSNETNPIAVWAEPGQERCFYVWQVRWENEQITGRTGLSEPVCAVFHLDATVTFL